MKRYITFLFLLLTLGTVDGQKHKDKDHSCCKKSAKAKTAETKTFSAPVGLPDMSIYNLQSAWQDQHGNALKLPQLAGKVQLVAMIYTSCGYACPRIVADLKRIESSLKEFQREDVGIVIVTMDPQRDTPETLLQFAKDNKLDLQRWTLLTGSQDNIREIAALLNMKYKAELNGDISHSNIISVLNANGEIVHQQEGLGVEPDETLKSIKSQLQKI